MIIMSYHAWVWPSAPVSPGLLALLTPIRDGTTWFRRACGCTVTSSPASSTCCCWGGNASCSSRGSASTKSNEKIIIMEWVQL